MIALRKRYSAFGRGTLEFLFPKNHKVLAFVRRYREEQILVVANLSRFVQCVELDLSAFKGLVPTEMFGRTQLPLIEDRPYLLTLSPFGFYWLTLEPKPVAQALLAPAENRLPTLTVSRPWQNIFESRTRESLEKVLLGYLRNQRWFAGQGGEPKSARIIEQIRIPRDGTEAHLTFIQVEYAEDEPMTFLLPIAFAVTSPQDSSQGSERSVICLMRLVEKGKDAEVGVLYDPLGERDFARTLLDALSRQRRFRGEKGVLGAWTTRDFQHSRQEGEQPREAALARTTQNNTSLIYDNRFLLKVYRRVEEGIHPEVELERTLTEKTSFQHLAPILGTLYYRNVQGQSTTLATLLSYVPNEGTAWQHSLDALKHYFEHILAKLPSGQALLLPNRPFLDLVAESLPTTVSEQIGPYLGLVRLMGQRTAELHLALASITDDPAFAPEPFTVLYQKSSYQTIRTWVFRVFNLLREHVQDLPEQARADAQILLARTSDLIVHLRSILSRRITAQRIRCHGDYHLANILYTGKDFVLVDFEGDVLRPFSYRRYKRSPLRDVASLMHSFHFAVHTVLGSDHLRTEDKRVLEPWARFWELWVDVAFVKAYLENSALAAILPQTREEMQILLDFHLLSRGVFELRYQLLFNSEQAHIPLKALKQLLELQDRRSPVSAEVPTTIVEET